MDEKLLAEIADILKYPVTIDCQEGYVGVPPSDAWLTRTGQLRTDEINRITEQILTLFGGVIEQARKE